MPQKVWKSVPKENIVSQHKRDSVAGNERFSDEKGLCQSLGLGLNRIVESNAPLRTITQEALEL
jgi:hypothetical protein